MKLLFLQEKHCISCKVIKVLADGIVVTPVTLSCYKVVTLLLLQKRSDLEINFQITCKPLVIIPTRLRVLSHSYFSPCFGLISLVLPYKLILNDANLRSIGPLIKPSGEYLQVQ